MVVSVAEYSRASCSGNTTGVWVIHEFNFKLSKGYFLEIMGYLSSKTANGRERILLGGLVQI